MRIEGESQRLRRIVEDLLWLARFDSQPPPPGAEPLDLGTIAGQCADRFQAVAHSQSLDISVTGPPEQAAWISAPPEWIDRLTGVLVDNACRYAGPGGSVRLGVATRGNRVSLTVEDSGPGIPAAERHRLFDRFHRVPGPGDTEQGGGAGLGLAIADSIVRFDRRPLADRRVIPGRRALRGLVAGKISDERAAAGARAVAAPTGHGQA